CVTTQYCGDGIINGPETCDDGNTNNGDGCSSTCQHECIDSDGGINYYLRGNTSKGNVTYTDYCTNSTTILEFYCNNNIIQNIQSSCTNGCSQGECSSQSGATSLFFEAENGSLTGPYNISSGILTLGSNGKANYTFTVSVAGNYAVKAFVNAPDTGTNSFFIGMDSDPSPVNYSSWDILPLTTGFQERNVSLRGNGTADINEFNPVIFYLSTGTHTFFLRGREINTAIDNLTIYKVQDVSPPSNQTQCNDLIDNDGDGFIDLFDPGCLNENDNDETHTTFLLEHFTQNITTNGNINQTSIRGFYWDGNTSINSYSSGYSSQSLGSNLIGYWNFNSYSGNNIVQDNSGNGNNGNITGSLTYNSTAGKLGGAFVFNEDGAIRINNETPFKFGTNQNFSFMMWFNLKEDSGLFKNRDSSVHNGITCFTEWPRYVKCLINGSNAGTYQISGLNSVQLNKWHHLVVTGNRNGLLKIYIDGQLGGSIDISGIGSMDSTNANHFVIAPISIYGGSYSTNGTIDEVAVWNRVLSDSEISNLYNIGLQGHDSSLRSNIINTNGQYYSIKANWSATNYTGINVSISVNNGSSWCEMSNNRFGLVNGNCILYPTNNFIYKIDYLGQGTSIDFIRFDWYDHQVPECADSLDNDNDGFADNGDFACQQGGVTENSFLAQCQDGVDNDADGLIDLNDQGCFSSQDNDETYAGGVTTISISDNIVQTDVKRLGIVMGPSVSYDTSINYLKHILSNPGIEGAQKRQVVLIDQKSGGNPTDEIYQFYWDPAWNIPQEHKGQPQGHWNGGYYEIVTGPAAGYQGQILNFFFKNHYGLPDGNCPGGNCTNAFKIDQFVPKPNWRDVMFIKKKFYPYIAYSDENYAPDTIFRPGSPGIQSVRYSPGISDVGTMDAYWSDADRSSGKGILVKGNFSFGFWGRAQNNGDKIRFEWYRDGEAEFMDREFTLTTNWQYYEYNFSVAPGVDPDRAYSSTEYHPMLRFKVSTFGNTGYVWVDDRKLYKLGSNPTEFTDDAVNRLKEYNPGVIRYWAGQFGEDIDSATRDPYGRGPSEFAVSYDIIQGDYYGLHEFLELSKEVGAEPWYVISPTYNVTELNQLVDFLAGPTTTQYGARRAALGHPAPWTDDFNNIYIEYGNELWGSGGHGDPFVGGSVGGGSTLGYLANRSFAIMRSNPNFNNKIKLIIGGQAGWVGQNQLIQSNSNQHNLLVLAPYFNPPDSVNPSNTEAIFSYIYAWPTFSVKYGNMKGIKDVLVSSGQGTEMGIYEINYHSTGSPNEGLPVPIRNAVLTGQGGGLAMPLNMLTYMKYLGVKKQTAFTFTGYSFSVGKDSNNVIQYVKLWGMIGQLQNPGSKRGTFLANEVANKGIFGDMVNTSHSGDNPTWIQTPLDSISQAVTVPFIQSFAFRQGTNRSVLLFNLHRTDSLNVQIFTPAIPSSSAMKYVYYSNDIYASNENASYVVNYTTTQINNFSNGYMLSLPPHSLTVLKWNDNLSLSPDIEFNKTYRNKILDRLLSPLLVVEDKSLNDIIKVIIVAFIFLVFILIILKVLSNKKSKKNILSNKKSKRSFK
ncbi:MAG: LamG-like jellyroll fold domain-containing protein, partial [Candidatus Pacearchaeota archaeon]